MIPIAITEATFNAVAASLWTISAMAAGAQRIQARQSLHLAGAALGRKLAAMRGPERALERAVF